MTEIEEQRISISQPQYIRQQVFIDEVIVERNLYADEIIYPNSPASNNTISPRIITEEFKIDTLIAHDDITVDFINGRNISDIFSKVVWLNRPNVIPGHWVFLDETYIDGNITTEGKLNDIYFNYFVENIIYRNETVHITSDVVFKEGFHVYENLTVDTLNDVKPENILLKSKLNNIKSNIIIEGNVEIDHLTANEINDKSIETLSQRYSYDEYQSAHIIHGDVNITETLNIYNLVAEGSFNDIPNVDRHLENIVQRDVPINITGRIIFEQPVDFFNDVHISRLNIKDGVSNLDFQEFLNNIVMIDQVDPIYIYGDLVFEGPLIAESVYIHGNLSGDNISGMDPYDMIHNTLMIDRDYVINCKLKNLNIFLKNY